MVKIIGQAKTRKTINTIVASGFPHFIIINGARGAQSDLIALHIAECINAQLIAIDNKVDDVRKSINLAQTITDKTVYFFQDAQDMSLSAKNALLKITEEAPTNAYFIMTVTSLDSVLTTLVSRAYILHLDIYYPLELEEYATLRGYSCNELEYNYVYNTCRTPGDVDLIFQYNITEFYDFVKKVLSNIGKVTGVNALKIPKSLSASKDAPGYDVVLFLRAFKVMINLVLTNRTNMDWLDEQDRPQINPTNILIYARMIAITNYYLGELENITGITLLNTVDMWILDIKEVIQLNQVDL